MTLPEPNVVLRARGPLESVDLAFPFIARLGGRRYAALCALVFVPCLGVIAVLHSVLGLPWLQCWCVAGALAVWLQGMFTAAAGEAMFSGEVRAGSVLRTFARRLVPYTAALVASRLLVLAVAPSVVLVPFVWARFAFVPEAVLLEGAGAGSALSRAGRLARANRGRMVELVFAIAVVLGLGVVFVESFSEALLEDVLKLGLSGESLFEDGGSYYAVAGFFAAVPLCATVRFLSYIDGRARGDAWDVQVKFQRIARAESQAP